MLIDTGSWLCGVMAVWAAACYLLLTGSCDQQVVVAAALTCIAMCSLQRRIAHRKLTLLRKVDDCKDLPMCRKFVAYAHSDSYDLRPEDGIAIEQRLLE
jgi:hypothetical protein